MVAKEFRFDRLKPLFLEVNDEGASEECLYNLDPLFSRISETTIPHALCEMSGDRYFMHKCDYDEQHRIWEIQIVKLRDILLPGVADMEGHYELIDLGEGKFPAESSTILYDADRCNVYLQRNKFALSPSRLAQYLAMLTSPDT